VAFNNPTNYDDLTSTEGSTTSDELTPKDNVIIQQKNLKVFKRNTEVDNGKGC
jgi:hypothetical protein